MSNPEDRYTEDDIATAEQMSRNSAGTCPNCNGDNTEVLWREKDEYGTWTGYLCLDCSTAWTITIGGTPE